MDSRDGVAAMANLLASGLLGLEVRQIDGVGSVRKSVASVWRADSTYVDVYPAKPRSSTSNSFARL
jgi:hypothetical protein